LFLRNRCRLSRLPSSMTAQQPSAIKALSAVNDCSTSTTAHDNAQIATVQSASYCLSRNSIALQTEQSRKLATPATCHAQAAVGVAYRSDSGNKREQIEAKRTEQWHNLLSDSQQHRSKSRGIIVTAVLGYYFDCMTGSQAIA
jgi:hypothetical protein